MTEVKFQPSLAIESFFSDDLANDSERFLLFLKAYYEWLQTSKLTFVGASRGFFERDEVITGSSSGATGIVKEVGTNYIIVLVTSRIPFDIGERVVGSTSLGPAEMLVGSIKENVVRASGNLLNNRYIETTIDQYQDYLKSELYDSIPKDFLGDKRTVALKFKKYFESKSNEESYRFLFRLLYNEPVEFYYPGEDLLRPSDGNFEKTNIIRVVVSDNIFDFFEKTIRGQTSGTLANVVDVKTFFVGGTEVAEFTLKLVSGVFSAGETIVDIANEDLTSTVYGIVSNFTINDGGSGYSVGTPISIFGDGSEAQARVSSVSDAPISRLIINTVGHGYRLGTEATVNNSGTGGSGLLVRATELTNTYSYTDANTSSTYTLGEISRVQILSRGTEYLSAPTITLEDTVISSLGLLSPELITIANSGVDYGVGNTLVFTGGSGANAAGQVASVEESTTYDFLFEDGFRMLSEDSYYDIIKNEDWEVVGPITRVELTNFGDGYETANLPSITVTTTTGSGANLVATNIQGKSADIEVDVANNDIGIGAIRAIEVTNFGIDYTSAVANTSIIGDGNANVTINISGLGIKDGNWVNDDGKLNYKFIQDSFYYQNFSYVIKSGLAFSFYKNVIKNIIHPAGLQPFGQILISSFFDVSPTIVNTDVVKQIEQYIIYIESFFSIGLAYTDSFVHREIEIHKNIDTSTDLLSQKEYVLQIPKGRFSTSISNDAEYQVEVILSGESIPSVESLILSGFLDPEVEQYVITLVNEVLASPTASEVSYGDIEIDTFSNQPILSISGLRFDSVFTEPVGTGLTVELELTSSASTTFTHQVTSTNFIFEKFVSAQTSSTNAIISRNIETPINTESTLSSEFSRPIENSLETQAQFNPFKLDIKFVNLLQDEITLNALSISKIVELQFPVFSGGPIIDETTSYAKIQGTVSSSVGSQYKDLLLDNFSTTNISSLQNETFEEQPILIVGSNTVFSIDFIDGDIIIANNEYFISTSVLGNTSLIIDRVPENAFSNVFAYKAI